MGSLMGSFDFPKGNFSAVALLSCALLLRVSTEGTGTVEGHHGDSTIPRPLGCETWDWLSSRAGKVLGQRQWEVSCWEQPREELSVCPSSG